jgi:hypothetical protein
LGSSAWFKTPSSNKIVKILTEKQISIRGYDMVLLRLILT